MSPRTSRAALVRRWTDDADLTVAVTRWLSSSTSAPPEGLDQHEDRIDLRGLPLGGTGDPVELRDVRWDGLDLSYADLTELRIFDATLTDCVFDRSSWTGTRTWGTTGEGCSFRGAQLRGASLASWWQGTGTVWRDTVFDGADLRRNHFVGTTLERCSFVRAKLSGVEFHRCALTDVVFEGRLDGVLFDGDRRGSDLDDSRPFDDVDGPVPLNRVDFSRATFADTEFRRCAAEDVTWPEDDDVHVIPDPADALTRAVAWLRSSDDAHADTVAKTFERDLERSGDVFVLNLRDGADLGDWWPRLAREALLGSGQETE